MDPNYEPNENEAVDVDVKETAEAVSALTPETDESVPEAVEENVQIGETALEEDAEITGEFVISEEETLPTETEDSTENEQTEPKPVCYLQYGGENIPTDLDLDGTLSFLNEQLKFDGGELRKARCAKDGSAIVDFNSGASERCSYCKVPITGVDYYRLPDGRRRCTGCSRSLVSSKEELRTIFKTVLNNLEAFFGATIDVTMSVEMIEERKLKKKIKKGLDTPLDGVVILGVAVEKNKEYTVYIENGAPRASVIATFAHELTHIWQYTHWNRKNLKKKYGKKKLLEVYEGMAKWVEIQYMFNIGESTMAKREREDTLRRNDEYGNGFIMFEDRYPISDKTVSFDVTPFTNKNDPL